MDAFAGHDPGCTKTSQVESSKAFISPRNGRHVAYVAGANGLLSLRVTESMGSASDGLLLKVDTPPVLALSDWSPDKRFILYARTDPRTNHDLWLLDQASRTARPLLQTPSREVGGQFSPDGRWIAYASDESGRWEVYVQPFPLTGAKWQVSPDGGQQPWWRHDAKEIFYIAPDRRLMAASVSAAPPFAVHTHAALFRMQSTGPHPFRPVYAVSEDGQRFLVPIPQSGTIPITVVVNPAALARSPSF
jgi:dipeptidyl aminopeptidase/acylaminoacyl peptidase